jgi:phage tail-like protein
MSFSNQDYFYSHLPSRYRREDKELFLKRFWQFFGATLDEWDADYIEFYSQINPFTADEVFVDWWLQVLFEWSWFPAKFTLPAKRNLYANMARHFARRGTPRGIELWLNDFGAIARVFTRETFWDDSFFGEGGWEVAQPLVVLVEIIALKDWGNYDLGAWDDSFWEDSTVFGAPEIRLTDVEIETLLRFVQPHGQEIFVVWKKS